MSEIVTKTMVEVAYQILKNAWQDSPQNDPPHRDDIKIALTQAINAAPSGHGERG